MKGTFNSIIKQIDKGYVCITIWINNDNTYFFTQLIKPDRMYVDNKIIEKLKNKLIEENIKQ